MVRPIPQTQNGNSHLARHLGQRFIDCNGLGNKKALGDVYGNIDDSGQMQVARMIAISTTSSQIILALVQSRLLVHSMNSRVTTKIPNSYSQVQVRTCLPTVDLLDDTWRFGNRPMFECPRSPVLWWRDVGPKIF